VAASTGEASTEYEYGPFGDVIRATGPMALKNPIRFSSKYQDPESGLLYYGLTLSSRWERSEQTVEK